MTAIETTETEVSELQLCQEIDSLNNQIAELQTHLSSLKNQPTYELSPQNLTPAEVIQLAKKVAAAEQKAALQQTEAKAINQAIVSLEAQVEGKRRELGELKDREGFEKLLALASEFNNTIDKAVQLLEQMKEANRGLSGQRLEVHSVELRELPYTRQYGSLVKVRRRFDILVERS